MVAEFKYWDTAREAKFVMELGVGNMDKVAQTSRLDMLKGYRVGASRRTDWGDIDKRFIFILLAEQIRQEKEAQDAAA